MTVLDLQVLFSWDARAFATTRITPAYAKSALVTWEASAVTAEGSDALHRRLARGLASLGEVCFRTAGAVPPGARPIGMVKASRLPWRRAWSVIGSRDPAAVLTLFDGAWSQGDQTAIIGAGNDDWVREILGLERLTDVRLMEGELLVSATVDGAALLLCAASAARMETAIEALRLAA